MTGIATLVDPHVDEQAALALTPLLQSAAHPVVIIGAGPAGLMAAEQLLNAGIAVDLYDAMPSPGRKFLLAGIGGLNLTHSEPMAGFRARYGAAEAFLAPMLASFGADELRAWAQTLGVETFVGSSGRVFPREMKAAPLLRRWLQRLRSTGLRLHTRQRWLGWQQDSVDVGVDAGGDALAAAYRLRFATPSGQHEVLAQCVILALGGGSWARLGSDAAWYASLQAQGIALTPLQPANCGFEAGWSEVLQSSAGSPLKSVAITLPWLSAVTTPLLTQVSGAESTSARKGECILTRSGLEGSLIYALSAAIREHLSAIGEAVIHMDLLPDRSLVRVQTDLQRPRGKLTQTRHWQRAGLDGAKAALLRDHATAQDMADPVRLAALIKAVPIRLLRTRPLDEAISTAGGVCFSAVDEQLMLRAMPGIFCAGEMLDWEAPTGGYLLTACFATGRVAGQGALSFLRRALT